MTGSQAATPFVAYATGNDIDHAAQRVRTVQGRQRPAHDFHLLDGLQWHPAELQIAEPEHLVGGGNAFAIDQHQGMPAFHATDADHAPAQAAYRADVQAGGVTDGIQHIPRRARAQLFASDDSDAGRCTRHAALAGRGSHHDAVQFSGGFMGGGSRHHAGKGKS